MKHCPSCRDTSPDDARFCITCGCAFAATGATQRMSSAGAQTTQLEGSAPSSIAGATPVGISSTVINGRTLYFGTVASFIDYPPVIVKVQS